MSDTPSFFLLPLPFFLQGLKKADERRREDETSSQMSEPPSSQDDSSKSTEECLIYLEQYGALICKLCRYALCPNGVALHYQRHHKDLLSASQRRELIRFEQSVTVVDTQQLILNSPRDVGPAILGLKVIKAQECLQCAFIGGTERSIQEHCRSIHKWRHQDGLS